MPESGRPSGLDATEDLIAEIAAGRMVVLVDDEDRENEGDLVMAADAVTPEAINFMARYGRGLICLTLTQDRCRQLNLPLMVLDNRATHTTAFTVSIEAAAGVTTGISAADRAHTIATAVADGARADDLVQPGHIFPLMAQPGGVLARAGHTEAGCDLAALAGRRPAGVICEILNEDGSMARLPDLRVFAKTHGLKLGSIADLIHHRTAHESLVTRLVERPLQDHYRGWRCLAYQDKAVGQAHLALVMGQPNPQTETLVRVHEPLTVLDLLGLDQTLHSWPVAKAMQTIAQRGCGVLVFLNCGSQAQVLLDQLTGSQTAAAQPVQGSNGAASSLALRNYGLGAAILKDLGVGRMRLLAQPRKMPSMMGFGLEVTGYLQSGESA